MKKFFFASLVALAATSAISLSSCKNGNNENASDAAPEMTPTEQEICVLINATERIGNANSDEEVQQIADEMEKAFEAIENENPGYNPTPDEQMRLEQASNAYNEVLLSRTSSLN